MGKERRLSTSRDSLQLSLGSKPKELRAPGAYIKRQKKKPITEGVSKKPHVEEP